MKTLLMVIFVISFILGVLRSLADKVSTDSAKMCIVVMILSFVGMMIIALG